MWPSSSSTTPHLHYTDMAFLGLRDILSQPSSYPPPPPPTSEVHFSYHPDIIDPRITPLQQQQSQEQEQSVLEKMGVVGWGLAYPGSLTRTTNCEDCGNQRKKDCLHQRCRTCCRNRGFTCATHVKSTWVPAVRRREKKAAASAAGAAAGSSGSSTGTKSKKGRVVVVVESQTTTTTTTNSHASIGVDTGSSYNGDEGGGGETGKKGEVRSRGVFKCMRVRGVEEEGEDEYAYQGMVEIGGRVFKGVLYDQGCGAGGRVSDFNLEEDFSLMKQQQQQPLMDVCGGFLGWG